MDLRTLRYFVAVAEERHVGRAAARLHMTQPPLSRALRALERELGVELLARSAQGVVPTAAGVVLLAEARELLARAEVLRQRVTAAGELRLGSLASGLGEAAAALADEFRRAHPEASVRVREADLTDPSCGLRAGLVDVAVTRTPFDTTGIETRLLRREGVGVVLRADDPLAGRARLVRADLAGRRWFRFAEGTDPGWAAYWQGPGADSVEAPVVRTVSDCQQAVLWSGSVGLAPLGHHLGDGLVVVPLADQPPSDLVVAWRTGGDTALVRTFTRIALRVLGQDSANSSVLAPPPQVGAPPAK
ncbi:DNA-binding transcriptional LysR family regulator [Crossiella equi]|uniref:DNA-binding transcriptional LysR family regulator n=1 Tax=Crossiella equi TaxID=130796 RepID=A0ABS5A6T1_9PSEU|nr:LysR substrate-binding domain-containing protein [Crossiella equi]MBP2472295.1 DNA-binding transcriptional LysR family regulator [Crossiella equi]